MSSVNVQLHMPMYLLLSQLSLMDLMYISSTVPNMAFNFFSGQKRISLLSCKAQSFFFLIVACSEGLFLASMTYDTFVVICHPLHYIVLMNRRTLGSINSLVHTFYALHLPYCRYRAINHFFCHVPTMLAMAFVDTWVYEYMVFVNNSLFLLLPFLGISASYGRVLFADFHMRSKQGRKKAFNKCSIHLTVVTLYCAPFVYTYLLPRSLQSPEEDKILAVFYTILIPILNPFIYSLCNREVLRATERDFGVFSSKK